MELQDSRHSSCNRSSEQATRESCTLPGWRTTTTTISSLHSLTDLAWTQGIDTWATSHIGRTDLVSASTARIQEALTDCVRLWELPLDRLRNVRTAIANAAFDFALGARLRFSSVNTYAYVLLSRQSTSGRRLTMETDHAHAGAHSKVVTRHNRMLVEHLLSGNAHSSVEQADLKDAGNGDPQRKLKYDSSQGPRDLKHVVQSTPTVCIAQS